MVFKAKTLILTRRICILRGHQVRSVSPASYNNDVPVKAGESRVLTSMYEAGYHVAVGAADFDLGAGFQHQETFAVGVRLDLLHLA